MSPVETLQRGGDYIDAGACRQMKAAHYLNNRINRDTAEEDIQLTIWSCEAAQSSGYQGIILSDLEYGVRAHHDGLREIIPALNLDAEPDSGTLADVNASMQ